jgi:hypothetical protein
MDEMTPYQFVYTFDPFTGTRIVTGAMMIVGHTVVYVGRAKPPKASKLVRTFVMSHADSLNRQTHPWEIGPQCIAEGRWQWTLKGKDPAAWIQRMIEKDLMR